VVRIVRIGLVAAVIGGLLSVPAPAGEVSALTKQFDSVIERAEYQQSVWGVLVVDAKTGETVYARNPDTLIAPASVTKLFTCAAALTALGPDHAVETAVYARGVTHEGVHRGDLILVAAGDLTFGGRTTKDGRVVFRDKDHTYANSGLFEADLTDTDPLAGIDALAKQVRAAGIKQIDGDVLVDERLFARTRTSGSGPEAATSIVVNDNLIDVLVEPGEKAGDPARVTMRPQTGFVQMDAVVATGAAGARNTVQIHAVGPNQFAIRGQIARDSRPVLRIYPVDDPALFARAVFVESLRRHGVAANPPVNRQLSFNLPDRDLYPKLPKVAAYTSPPFKDTIRLTLKVSHNLYASTLPSLLAASKGQTTSEAGMKEQRAVLKDLGVDVNAVSFGGGAGGAPADHVTPRATVQLLQGMSKRPEWPVYRDALPVLGVDGTLADAVKPESLVRGKASAKTGTLIWYDTVNDRYLLKSKALAGVMTTKAGAEVHFAFFVNNVPVPREVGATREGKAMGRLCELLYEYGP
jgi:D-alanyl-D-alanine carboxypeptidase/D-alanyl-D-alanine-endopeptidase (penicillin-binding protein 4)